MSISFFIGGARSGKSISAENYTLNLGNNPFYMATCEILDEEMALRVKRHQQSRDKNWTTIVAPLDISGEIQKIGTRGPVLIDCLTLWLSNHLLNKNNQNTNGIDQNNIFKLYDHVILISIFILLNIIIYDSSYFKIIIND